MPIHTVNNLLQLDAGILSDGESPLGVPLDITYLLMAAWRTRGRQQKSAHPYLNASGCYVISDDMGTVLYIGCTSHSFVKYLRVKLGIHRNSSGGTRFAPAYWESTLKRLDHSREDVRTSLNALREGRYRVNVIPVYGNDEFPGDRWRAIATLETKLIVRHEESVGHRPPLNYAGLKHDKTTSISHLGVPKKNNNFLARDAVTYEIDGAGCM